MALDPSIEVVLDDLTAATGIALMISPGADPNSNLELWRAPDSAGAPDTANQIQIFAGKAPAAGLPYFDLMPMTTATFWYATRTSGGVYGTGQLSDWVNLGAPIVLTYEQLRSMLSGDPTTRSPAWEQVNARMGPQGNILPNPGFEDGESFWTSDLGTVTYPTNSSEARSGNRYAKITTTTGNPGTTRAADDLGRSRYFEVNTDELVQFGGYAYRVSGTANVRYILELTDKDKGSATTYATPNQNTAAWVLVQAQQIVPSGKKFARIWCEVDSTGTGTVARFDDAFMRIALVAINDVPPPNTLYQIRFANVPPDPDTVEGLQSYIDFPSITNFMRTGRTPVAISSSTNATPTVITTGSAHNLVTNDVVTIRGHSISTYNGTWTVTVLTSTTFSLNDSTANGAGSGGKMVRLGMRVKANGDVDIFGVLQADSFSSRLRGQGRSLLQTLTYEIPNAEFDVWDSPSQPTAWTVDTGDSSVAAQDSTNVFAGDYSCKFSFGGGGSAGTYRGITTNDPVRGASCIPLHPNTFYQFKFPIRVSSAASSPTCRVTITTGGTPSSQSATFTFRQGNVWQVEFFKFKTPVDANPKSSLTIEFSRNSTTATDFWIDDVRMADRGTLRTVFLLSGSSWTVPSDFNPLNNMVELIGGGAGGQSGTTNTNGGRGGGGGGYRFQRNFDPGTATTVSYQIGTGGASDTNGGNTTWNSSAVVANGGTNGASGTGGGGSGGTGGNSGGTGAAGSVGTGNRGGGGAGGAGGATSAGVGGSAASGTTGGNGGAGGSPNGGTGGTGATNGTGGAGGDGTAYKSTEDGTTTGSGGGGGGGGVTSGVAKAGGAGGFRGGGGGGGTSTSVDFGAGGAGRDGVIVITWTTPVV